MDHGHRLYVSNTKQPVRSCLRLPSQCLQVVELCFVGRESMIVSLLHGVGGHDLCDATGEGS